MQDEGLSSDSGPASARKKGVGRNPRRYRRTPSRAALLAFAAAVSTLAAPAPRPPARVATPAPADTLVYTCAMHPDVRAAAPGVCPVCGMPLVSLAALRAGVAYGLELEQDPDPARPGVATRFRFVFRDPATGAPARDFVTVHEMPFHLFLVSDDLAWFRHLHPVAGADGSFALETVLPRAGKYAMFCDVFPAGGAPQVIRRDLVVSGEAARPASGPSFVDDAASPKIVDGVRFTLSLLPPEPVAGRPSRLIYELADAETGAAVTDLQPYLGAWGHAVALRGDLSDFLHGHAPMPPGRKAGRAAGGGPRLVYDVVFTRPGPHRIWAQIERGGRVVTVPFTLTVSRLDRVARRDRDGWATLGGGDDAGLDGAVRALAAIGPDVYAGGDFTRAGGGPALHVARWDGRRWSPVGEGLDGAVWALATDGRRLYAGGQFASSGGRRVRGVARWDGSRWTEVGGGVSGVRDPDGVPAVYALAARGGSLYAGGRFTHAGAVAADGIARWDGRRWSALGEGVRTGIYDGVVRALAPSRGGLVAGGQFLTAGGVEAHNVALWDGHAWSALGGGVRGGLERVLALGVDREDVYVGGSFGRAGDADAPNLARWNGRAWAPADARAEDGVWALAVSDGVVYAGGAAFRDGGSAPRRGIVRAGGKTGPQLDGGLGTPYHPGPVMAIVEGPGGLFVGGDAFRLPEADARAGGERGENVEAPRP